MQVLCIVTSDVTGQTLLENFDEATTPYILQNEFVIVSKSDILGGPALIATATNAELQPGQHRYNLSRTR